jgi:hypothetical protein
MNLVEMISDEQEPSPCIWGNVVVGHACYCHHDDGPRKCRLYWGGVEEMKTCDMFEPVPEASDA